MMRTRDAVEADGAACAAIYAPYVRDTAITFEVDEPDATTFTERIARAQQRHAWVVAQQVDRVVGYAYGSEYKARAAYRWSCEVSVYLEIGLRRSGTGGALYEALFARLAARGYRTAVAGMTLPNDASVGLHRAMGFEPVGTYRAIGWKHGRWHDVLWMQRPLQPDDGRPDDPPDEPR
jgi:phosphinothricin acetyltransferase